MVALSFRFTALAVLCSAASLTFPQAANAAAIGLRSTHDAHTGDSIPVIPLPSNSDAHSKRFVGAHGLMFASGDMWARRSSDAATVNIPRHEHHHYHHSADKVSNDEKIIVNDIVKVNSRSVLIPGVEGGSYIVKSNKRMMPQERAHARDWKRAEVTGVPGTVDIMSPTANSDRPQRVASLVLAQSNSTAASNGTDSSNSTAPATTFVLNASPDDKTQMFLVPMSNSSTSNSTQEIPVMLQVPVFDATSATSQAWCATFDPAPPQPESMTAEKCLDAAANGVEGDHKSQVFSYNKETGAVRPAWTNDVKPQSTSEDASMASVTDFVIPVRRQDAQAPFSDPASSTSSSSATSTASTSTLPSSTSEAPGASATPSSDASSGSIGNGSAQDVMLVFVPSEPMVNSVFPSSVSDAPAETTIPASSTTSSTATASAQAADVTPSSSASSAPTMTASPTVTSSSMPTATSAAAQASTSALASPSATDAMASTATSTSTASSSASSAASTATPAHALDVQVAPEPASDALSTGSAASSATAAPSASATAASTSSVASSAPSPVM